MISASKSFYICFFIILMGHCIAYSYAVHTRSIPLFVHIKKLKNDIDYMHECLSAMEISQEERRDKDSSLCLGMNIARLLSYSEYVLNSIPSDIQYDEIKHFFEGEIFFLQEQASRFFYRANVFPGIVHNDSLGVAFSGLIVNADVDPAAAIADTKLATITTSGKVSNSATTATSANTASAIVARDSSGNFSAGTITAALSGNATTATSATNFTGNLVGDVTGTQGATVVSFIGGQAASTVAPGLAAVNAATNLNTASTLVKRDASGSFAAGLISVTDVVASGNVSLSDSTSATVGNIVKNGIPFIHNFGTTNTFVGQGVGNFTMSGAGNNVAVGNAALSVNTTGSYNTVVGSGAGTGITTGTRNILVGAGAGTATTTGINNIYVDGNGLVPANESNTIRIGNTQTACYIKGISNVGLLGGAVVVSTAGQLGVLLSSARFKYAIQPLKQESEKIYDLSPVSFMYLSDTTNSVRYGLIAEEVQKIMPELVIKDAQGEPNSVSYDMLPVLLLHELKKQRAITQNLLQEVELIKSILVQNGITLMQ